jgi:hypothetical protein
VGIVIEESFDGQPLGVARVEMVSVEAAELALRTLHHLNISGRTVLVFRSSTRGPEGNSSLQSSVQRWLQRASRTHS